MRGRGSRAPHRRADEPGRRCRGPHSKTHLAIVPDGIDPSTYTISLGLLVPNEQSQFGTVDNAPDPAQVSTRTALVSYELVQIDWVDANGQRWERNRYAAGVHRKDDTQVRGTVLMQMLADRRLEVELFMGKTAAQVSAFTDAAIVYER